MNIAGKIGIGIGVVGAIAAVTALVVKLVNGNNEGKPVAVAADANAYCADDEVQKLEGWETSRPTDEM